MHVFAGHKCFEDFLLKSEYAKRNPCAVLALRFISTIKELRSQLPTPALEVITKLKREFINNPVRAVGVLHLYPEYQASHLNFTGLSSQLFVSNNVCQSPSLLADLEAKCINLHMKASLANQQNCNVKVRLNVVQLVEASQLAFLSTFVLLRRITCSPSSHLAKNT